MSTTQIVLSGLLVFTALTGFVDYRTGQIPNRLVAIGALIGLAVHFAVHFALIRQPDQVAVDGHDHALGHAALRAGLLDVCHRRGADARTHHHP